MATMKDVAREAGVSLGTVSKAVNGEYVSEVNRLKVDRAVKKLGYEMNYYARGLKLAKTQTIAVLIPNITNPFFARFVFYVETNLYRYGYRMILCNTEDQLPKEVYYMKLARQNKVDGIIAITYNLSEEFVSENLNIVTLDRHFEKEACCVSSDNYEGGRMAAEILIGSGCRRLAFIRSGSNLPGETLRRGTGFVAGCEAHGQKCVTLDMGVRSKDAYRAEIEKFLGEQMKGGPQECLDGIFASSDMLAMMIVQSLQKHDFAIPEQVQVIGFDGVPFGDDYMVSSIQQPIERLAQACVENVLKGCQGIYSGETIRIPVSFIDGGTTKPLS